MLVTRFAPSPNGPLHLGHAYSTIVAHDLAQDAGGQFLLRIEDIDGPRSNPKMADMFLDDLAWLGLSWDMVPAQSSRLEEYLAAGEKLKMMGLLYPCNCTRSQVAAAAQTMGPDGPVYAGTCRKSPPASDEGAAWRLDVASAMGLTGPLGWSDAVAGDQIARADLAGDVVLMRKDAPASYHLAVTLDDATDGVTLVTRGRDLLGATHVHRLLQALLGLPVPRWHHHPLLVDEAGAKLAKRRGSPSLADRRGAGESGPKLANDIRAGRFPVGISLR